jgi:hypothetical protein
LTLAPPMMSFPLYSLFIMANLSSYHDIDARGQSHNYQAVQYVV